MRINKDIRIILGLIIGAIIGIAIPCTAAPVITDVPDALEGQYDLTWEMTATLSPNTPMILELEKAADKTAYQIRIDGARVCWSLVRDHRTLRSVTRTYRLPMQLNTAFTVKRRYETVAILCAHRLILSAPAPRLGEGLPMIRQLPNAFQLRKYVTTPSALVYSGMISCGESLLKSWSPIRRGGTKMISGKSLPIKASRLNMASDRSKLPVIDITLATQCFPVRR